MNRTETSFSQEVRPIFLCVLIVNAILEVVREQILEFYGGRESYSHVRINTMDALVGIQMESEIRTL